MTWGLLKGKVTQGETTIQMCMCVSSSMSVFTCVNKSVFFIFISLALNILSCSFNPSALLSELYALCGAHVLAAI